jgi:hypothetical protein
MLRKRATLKGVMVFVRPHTCLEQKARRVPKQLFGEQGWESFGPNVFLSEKTQENTKHSWLCLGCPSLQKQEKQPLENKFGKVSGQTCFLTEAHSSGEICLFKLKNGTWPQASRTFCSKIVFGECFAKSASSSPKRHLAASILKLSCKHRLSWRMSRGFFFEAHKVAPGPKRPAIFLQTSPLLTNVSQNLFV